jgi:hypothetical protein
MSQESVGSWPLLERLQAEIARADRAILRLAKLHRWFVVGGLSLTGLATAVAGFASAAGPPVGEGPPAWRITCGAVAFCTALAGVFTGLNERFDYGGRLASARTCATRLRALELSLSIRARDEEDVARQYEEILSQHPAYDA